MTDLKAITSISINMTIVKTCPPRFPISILQYKEKPNKLYLLNQFFHKEGISYNLIIEKLSKANIIGKIWTALKQ